MTTETKTYGSAFAEYATSTAFHLSLSRPMIAALLTLHETGEPDLAPPLTTYHSLERRGLVVWRDTPSGRRRITLTEAGKLTAKLVLLAGFER